ncbi:hypothetical protein [Pseudomonas phage LKA1]|uniref:Transposase n=1 Tax=Pseudomonas phage LKA1 TaxID=386793 RepID=Q0E5Z9_9CAUD|nr:hypothetical protein AV952_gp15 [Pseudomonas phage LKA1]CAK24983.1 hypothetical protein [Pseudomonas phage LKA1]
MAKAWRKISGENKRIRRLGIMADRAFRVNPGVSARMAWLLRSTGVVPAHDYSLKTKEAV